MNIFLASQVWTTIYETFSNVFSAIGNAVANNVVISILTFSLVAIIIIYRVIRNRYTTEVKTYKAIGKINEYLSKNPFITDNNLAEFNRIMMNSPKTIRFQWQRYIINRTKKPSDFLTEENCVNRPLRVNSYKQGLRNFLILSLVIFVISSVLVVSSYFINVEQQVGAMIQALSIPFLGLFVCMIYTALGDILYNAIMSDLYYSFSNFERNIDRAVVNMPETIDYEMIFTPKEIQNNIPALQEYLTQRALYEQEQIQKAKDSEVEHEVYNFDDLGVDGSLVMQRALKESELYLGNRRRLLAEIETIQSEKSSVTKDYDEENKDYQRNLRDIREEISKLKAKIETVTNEITRSSLRRQQSAEVEKEQGIERQIEKATAKYTDKIEKLDAEIAKKRKEIEEIKVIAEKALTDEFKHFSDKIYVDLKKVAEKDVKEKIDKLEKEKSEFMGVLEEKDKTVAEKLALYEDKIVGYDNLVSEVKDNRLTIDELKNKIQNLTENLENKEQEILISQQEKENVYRELEKKTQTIQNFKKNKVIEIYRYFDANGNEFYFDDNGIPYYKDDNGNVIYYEQNTEGTEPVVQPENVKEEVVLEPEEKKVEIAEGSKENEAVEEKEIEKKVKKIKQEQTENVDEIEETLNKLAKATEEKIKESRETKTTSATKKTNSAKKSDSSNKNTKKKSSGKKN